MKSYLKWHLADKLDLKKYKPKPKPDFHSITSDGVFITVLDLFKGLAIV